MQVELKIESVKSRLDKNGQIKKSDFIEHSIEAKLLDLTDSSNARKTIEGTHKRNVKQEKEDCSRKINTKSQVRFLAKIGLFRQLVYQGREGTVYQEGANQPFRVNTYLI